MGLIESLADEELDDDESPTNGKDILHLAVDLGEAFNKLDHALRLLEEAILAETRPYYFPPQYELQEPRRFVANQLTEIWNTTQGKEQAKPPATSGLYCVDPEILGLIEMTNQAKLVFKASVFKIRQERGQKHSIEADLRRDPTFNAALRRRGLSRLDLKACYQPIKFYTKPIRSYMFYWAKSHTRVKRFKVPEVRALLEEQMEHSESSEYALAYKAIAHLGDNEYLAKVNPVSSVGRPNLGANLTFADGKRKMIRAANTRLYLADSLPGHISTRVLDKDEDVSPKRTRVKTIIGDPISFNSDFHFYKVQESS